jgi:hypothetical protein
LLTLTGTNVTSIEVFRGGMSFMGSLVYFLGILIMSSRHYCRNGSFMSSGDTNWLQYSFMQLITVVSGLLALYLGTVFEIHPMASIGGTLFCLYILEKYSDIPWDGVGYYWSFAGLGALLYSFSVIASRYPSYFLFG